MAQLESNFESPGYEYLRTYQNMSNLYFKLVALNYRRDFCPQYKSPPIHRFYFAVPSKYPTEQKFSFVSLCAWLIKDKCQMNFELEPEEYENFDSTLSSILEALRLLLEDDPASSKGKQTQRHNAIAFSPARLRNGYGPEVIYTLNIFADRALEFTLESNPSDKRINVSHINGKLQSPGSILQPSGNTSTGTIVGNIIIGQPFVGGGLTTRPLGSYQVDDSTLLFDSYATNDDNHMVQEKLDDSGQTSKSHDTADSVQWYSRLNRLKTALEHTKPIVERERIAYSPDCWSQFTGTTNELRGSIQYFLEQSRSNLISVAARIDSQMEIIDGREKFLQAKLTQQLDKFLTVWRQYCAEDQARSQLVEQVNRKTDSFLEENNRLKVINNQIEVRLRDLQEGGKLKEIAMKKNQLKAESKYLNLKIGLLLTVYAKRQASLSSQSK